MWALYLLLTVTIAGLLTSIPSPSYAGGPIDRFGMGRADGFRTDGFRTRSTMSVPSRFPFRSARDPVIAGGSSSVEMAPPQVVVVPVVVQQQAPSEPPVPVPDPKFVSPPTQSAPAAPGQRTVIVQRGSKIETQSFLVDR